MLNKLDIPQDIIDAALKVRRWVEANDLKGWSLCGIGPVGSAALPAEITGMADVDNAIEAGREFHQMLELYLRATDQR